ncbi:antibiotic biosynthesis monooxygenase [Paroceanicella profunda]|uniref:Antibiotic biosynthesis monooxygenase n=1 Tax=Paroceanicella profunda TaxID=2579971 RepID=A0A5B8FGC9_9RHOB|nr:antibiotic biosynthesis monooxygenase [Paroceanicella profunda]QDL91031.1 antibiotic biosynthesis monooxygenase [Paroceanicella profunda]
MITITAIIRAQPGKEEAMRAALLDVAAHVQAEEPETFGFHLAQSLADPAVFTTYERFADEAAMERHNASAATARFFALGPELIEGDVILETCREFSAVT